MNSTSKSKHLWNLFWKLANPKVFMGWSGRWLPWLSWLTVLFLGSGLIWGFFFTPDDIRQGSTVKIIYLHVPAALMAINGYLLMFVGSLMWLIRRQHVSVLAAKAAAPVGMTMTLIALATGAIWGQPMWGTYWVWDPRLTSFLIMFLFYAGYIALWAAIDDDDTAADLTSVLALVGLGLCLAQPLCSFVLEPRPASGYNGYSDRWNQAREYFECIFSTAVAYDAGVWTAFSNSSTNWYAH